MNLTALRGRMNLNALRGETPLSVNDLLTLDHPGEEVPPQQWTPIELLAWSEQLTGEDALSALTEVLNECDLPAGYELPATTNSRSLNRNDEQMLRGVATILAMMRLASRLDDTHAPLLVPVLRLMEFSPLGSRDWSEVQLRPQRLSETRLNAIHLFLMSLNTSPEVSDVLRPLIWDGAQLRLRALLGEHFSEWRHLARCDHNWNPMEDELMLWLHNPRMNLTHLPRKQETDTQTCARLLNALLTPQTQKKMYLSPDQLHLIGDETLGPNDLPWRTATHLALLKVTQTQEEMTGSNQINQAILSLSVLCAQTGAPNLQDILSCARKLSLENQNPRLTEWIDAALEPA